MSKKVLVIYYSQSGQLADIADCLTAPLAEAGASIEKVAIQPVTAYPFPWSAERFYSVMPDCVLGVTAELAPFSISHCGPTEAPDQFAGVRMSVLTTM